MEQTPVGFVLAESTLRPLYANAEALQILAYPEIPSTIPALDSFVAAKLQSLLNGDGSSVPSDFVTEYVSGSRRYLCRAFPLTSNGGAFLAPAVVAVIFERNGGGSLQCSRIAAKYHLTAREYQTLQLLVHGLTNKEIGTRMTISPNTVKAFLKMIMLKMGVSTRSGIIGRALDLHL